MKPMKLGHETMAYTVYLPHSYDEIVPLSIRLYLEDSIAQNSFIS